MHQTFPSHRHALAIATLVAAITAAAVQATPVPVALQPAGAGTPMLTWSARGVQIYECRASSAGAAPTWTFVAPEAELFDAQGRPAGHHGAGPFWQALDGSRITAAVSARSDAPLPGAIPWLLLVAKPAPGAGVLSEVTHVQRVNTAGGAAPSDGCSTTTLGRQARVNYRAHYHFLSVAH